jgi:hypothetical protein
MFLFVLAWSSMLQARPPPQAIIAQQEPIINTMSAVSKQISGFDNSV